QALDETERRETAEIRCRIGALEPGHGRGALSRRRLSEREEKIARLGVRSGTQSTARGVVFATVELRDALFDGLREKETNDQRHPAPGRVRRNGRAAVLRGSGKQA